MVMVIDGRWQMTDAAGWPSIHEGCMQWSCHPQPPSHPEHHRYCYHAHPPPIMISSMLLLAVQVLNEIEGEHGMSPQTYTAVYDAIVTGEQGSAILRGDHRTLSLHAACQQASTPSSSISVACTCAYSSCCRHPQVGPHRQRQHEVHGPGAGEQRQRAVRVVLPQQVRARMCCVTIVWRRPSCCTPSTAACCRQLLCIPSRPAPQLQPQPNRHPPRLRVLPSLRIRGHP